MHPTPELSLVKPLWWTTRWLTVGLWSLLLTACATMTPVPDMQPGDLQRAYDRLRQDQARRTGRTNLWQVNGIMDLEMADGTGQRNRITLMGRGTEKARLLVDGPFHQTALEILVTPTWIQLIDIGKRTIVEVPATTAGMASLTKIPLAPARLFELALGITGPLTAPEEESMTARLFTESGEEVRLDPKTGQMVERIGTAGTQGVYSAVYQWGTPVGDAPAMPSRLHISLDDAVNLELIFQSWRFPDGDGADAMLAPSPAVEEFKVIRPMGAS